MNFVELFGTDVECPNCNEYSVKTSVTIEDSLKEVTLEVKCERCDFQKRIQLVDRKNYEEHAKILVHEIANISNGEWRWTMAVLENLKASHRTLQATTVRMFRSILNGYADLKGDDPRNVGAREFAKKVAQIDGAIPFI